MSHPAPRPDDPHEQLELLDDQGEPLGRGKPRGEVHRDGDWHRAFHLWVVRGDRHVLMQRRAKGKEIEAGRVDVSVGGHVRVGEALPDVVREAEEEIGLVVRPGDLSYVGTVRSDHRYPDAIDREFQDTYVVRDARDLREFRMDCREVSVLYEVPLDGLVDLCRGGARSLPVTGFDCQDRENNALLVEDDLIAHARTETADMLDRIRAWIAEHPAAR